MESLERASIRYSQNFLRSSGLVDLLLARSSIAPDDVVYEIGPGKGIITERLARACRRVVAIEKDPYLYRGLQERLGRCPAVVLRQMDFLDYRLPRQPYKVFASIPFNITTALVTKLTTADVPPDDAYLVVQAEAAERYTGAPRETLYALLLKPWFEPIVVHVFRRSDFAPMPGVDVVMLRLRKRGPPLVERRDAPSYRDFVTACFTAWRPTAHAALEAIVGRGRAASLARAAGLDESARPGAVPFEVWLGLFREIVRRDPAALFGTAGAEARLRREQAGLRKSHRTRSSRSLAGRAS